jgi:hypothetical protein
LPFDRREVEMLEKIEASQGFT